MIESERYFFTIKYYKEFLHRLQEVYSFATFQEGKLKYKNSTKPLVILRHDLDLSLEDSLNLSSIEKELGISATYFFLVRCPLYNVFSSSGERSVRRILAEGHHFGLHFDCSLYKDISVDKLDYYISRECELLEHFFEHPIEAISFHRPGRLELSGVELERWPNAYEGIFQEEFKYFSDSRGNWLYGHPIESEAFSKRESLHIAVHPVWWTKSPKTPYECLLSLVQQIRQRSEQHISENCQVWNEGKQLSKLIG